MKVDDMSNFAKAALISAVILLLAACGERVNRSDFEAAVKDRTTAEVTSRFGEPDAVDGSVAGTLRWTYTSKTFNVEGGTKMDARTIVVFRQTDPNVSARAVEVLYE